MGPEVDIDAVELLEPVFRELPDTRVGWPDEEARLRLRDVARLRATFARAVHGFRSFWAGRPTRAKIELYPDGMALDLRVWRELPPGDRLDEAAHHRRREATKRELSPQLRPLKEACLAEGATFEMDGLGDYFGFRMPVASIAPEGEGVRLHYPLVPDGTWDDGY